MIFEIVFGLDFFEVYERLKIIKKNYLYNILINYENILLIFFVYFVLCLYVGVMGDKW